MKKGFTLIELLIVVAVVGILASIAVVSLSDQTGNSIDATVKSGVSSLRSPAVAITVQNLSVVGSDICDELYDDVSTDRKADVWDGNGGMCTEALNVDAETGSDNVSGDAYSNNEEIGTICCTSSGKQWVIFGRLSGYEKEAGSTDSKDFFCADSENTFSIVDEDDITLTGASISCE